MVTLPITILGPYILDSNVVPMHGMKKYLEMEVQSHLGPYLVILCPWAQENFAPPSPLIFSYLVMCKQKNTKSDQKTKHYSVSLGYKIKAKINKTTKY
jgi:hypothetical protein